jgi:hypothetical protein
VRAMHKAHAINLLTREGMLDEARILLRSLLEISFTVMAIHKSDSFIERYVDGSRRQGLRFLKNLRAAAQFPETMYKFDGRIDEVIAELEKRSKRIPKTDVYDYAREAGVLPLYYGPYSILCSSVHSGAFDVQEYIQRGSDGNGFLVKKPDENDPDLVFFTAIESMKNILNSYADLTATKHEKIEQLNGLYAQLNGILHAKYVMGQDILEA